MMMNNMFSMFDPSSSYMSMGWLMLFMLMIMLKKNTFKKESKMMMAQKHITKFVSKEIDQMAEKKIKFSNPMFLNLFFLLFMANFMAIFPFNFTPTAHISISFSVSMTLWMSTMIFGWKNQFKNMMVHLTPMGTPNALMNFMVVIEVISAIIRPITLSIRLSANMVAGHLLMSLLSTFSMSNMKNETTSMIPMALLIMLEMGVALVQAYVLMTLMLLYQNETC